MDFKIVYERNTSGFKHLSVKVLYNETSKLAIIVGIVEQTYISKYDASFSLSGPVWNVLATMHNSYVEAVDWGIEIIDQWFTKWELEQEASENAE